MIGLLLGWAVALVDVGQFIPQARHTLRHRTRPDAMRGVSALTWSIATIQGAAWVVYGLGTRHYAVGIPNLVITPICAAILGMKLVSMRRDRAASAP